MTKMESCVVIFVPMDEPSAGTDLAEAGNQNPIFCVSTFDEKVFQKRANVIPNGNIYKRAGCTELKDCITRVRLVRPLTCGRVDC